MPISVITLSSTDAEEIRATLEYHAANGQLDSPALEDAYDKLETGVLGDGGIVQLDTSDASELRDALGIMDDAGELDEDGASAYKVLDLSIQDAA